MRPRRGEPSPTTEDLDRAVAWWRAVLSVPFPSYFLTRDDLVRAEASSRGSAKPPAKTVVEALQVGDLLVTRVTVRCEPASTDRRALLEHQSLPWLVVAGVNSPTTATTRVVGLVPVTFILAEPLTAAEQARLSAGTRDAWPPSRRTCAPAIRFCCV